MELSRKTKYILMGLLLLLVILIRLPSYPHERGSPDEFTLHALANSVSEFGYAEWWFNPLGVFGFYPYSYASSVPFFFSGISQCTGISIESCAWILCTFLGIFVVGASYIMAGQISNDDLFKFLVSQQISFWTTINTVSLSYIL